MVEHLVVAQEAMGSSPISHPHIFASVAQLVEQPPCKRPVVGSNPTGGSSTQVTFTNCAVTFFIVYRPLHAATFC